MKATLDIPDDLYRRVKARSAMEGRPVRSVAVELFENWVDAPATPTEAPSPVADPSGRSPTRFDDAPWLNIARRYVRPGTNHDMDTIRAAIAKGWGEEGAGKL
jgi:hypothetical protein